MDSSPIIRRIVSLFGHGVVVAIVALAGLALTPQSASAQGGASTKLKGFQSMAPIVPGKGLCGGSPGHAGGSDIRIQYIGRQAGHAG
jgi:hypothetical protein